MPARRQSATPAAAERGWRGDGDVMDADFEMVDDDKKIQNKEKQKSAGRG